MPAVLKLVVSSCLDKRMAFPVELRVLAPLVFEFEVPPRDSFFLLGPGCFLKTSYLFPTYPKTSWSLTHRPLKSTRKASTLSVYLPCNTYSALTPGCWIVNVSLHASRGFLRPCYCTTAWMFLATTVLMVEFLNFTPLPHLTPYSLGLQKIGIFFLPVPLWTTLT